MKFIQLKILFYEKQIHQNLRTQYQVQDETQLRRNQKVIETKNGDLIVKNCPKETTNYSKTKN